MNSFWCRARELPHTEPNSIQLKWNACVLHIRSECDNNKCNRMILRARSGALLSIFYALWLWQTSDSLRSRLAPEALFKNWNELFNRICSIHRHRRFLSFSVTLLSRQMFYSSVYAVFSLSFQCFEFFPSSSCFLCLHFFHFIFIQFLFGIEIIVICAFNRFKWAVRSGERIYKIILKLKWQPLSSRICIRWSTDEFRCYHLFEIL